MRLTVMTLALGLSALGARVEAAPGQSCIALQQGASRVVAMVANPQDCCSGRLQCAQFLSTTTVVRPAHDQRT